MDAQRLDASIAYRIADKILKEVFEVRLRFCPSMLNRFLLR
jgi:hypothetical protein